MARASAEFLRPAEVPPEWERAIDAATKDFVDEIREVSDGAVVRYERWYRDLPVWLIAEELDIEDQLRRLVQVALLRREGNVVLTGTIRFRRRVGNTVWDSSDVPEQNMFRLPVPRDLEQLPSRLRTLWNQLVDAKDSGTQLRRPWAEVQELRARPIS